MGAGGGGVGPAFSALLGGLEAEGEPLSGRAPIAIVLGVVAEVFFAKQAQAGVGGRVGFGDVGGDPSFEAGFDLLAVVVTHIRENLEPIYAERLFCAQCHLGQ